MRIAETKAINTSLMSLKECIRARTMASEPGAAADYFNPYRRSKLTLLMKDVFDIGCPRICSTVVLAAVNPLAKDVSHSANTLKYAAPLRVAAGVGLGLPVDPKDPAFWDSTAICEWVTTVAADESFDAAALCGGRSGRELCAMPEPRWFEACAAQGFDGHAAVAKRVYNALWGECTSGIRVGAKSVDSIDCELRGARQLPPL